MDSMFSWFCYEIMNLSIEDIDQNLSQKFISIFLKSCPDDDVSYK